jgi:hypothetical protein
VGVCLALLAKRTTLNIFTNEMRKAGPPIFSSNELAGLKISWMTSGGVVMGMSDDVATKRTRVRDINMVLVGEETIINLPVGEMRVEGRGNSAVEGLEGIADEDIITGGGGNEITQGSIDDLNKERWRKEGHIFIVKGESVSEIGHQVR